MTTTLAKRQLSVGPFTQSTVAAATPNEASVMAMAPDEWFDSTWGLYQDTGRTTLALAASDPVALWADRSPNKRDATASGASRPTLALSSLNGKNGVSFNGTTQYLARAFTQVAGTIIMVARLNGAATGSRMLIGAGGGPSSTPSYFMDCNDGSNANMELEYFRNDGTVMFRSATRVAPGTPFIQSAICAATPLVTLYSQGANVSSANAGFATNLATPSNPVLGANYTTAPSGFFQGEMFEVITFNRAITDAERQTIEAYLSAKWGITITNSIASLTAAYNYLSFDSGSFALVEYLSNDGVSFTRFTPSYPVPKLVVIGGSPTGGTFTLTVTTTNGNAQTTAAIAYNATAAAVQAALAALSNVGAANITVTGPAGGPYALMFPRTFGLTAFAATGSLTGGTAPTATVNVSLRDPTVWYENRVFYMAHTQSASTGTAFSIAKSTDLANWDWVANVDVTGLVPTANRVWAPEMFQDTDGSRHIFFSISTDAGVTQTIYETHPVVAGVYTAWSTPVPVTVTGAGSTPIDPFIVKVGSVYTMFLAGTSVVTATNLLGPYALSSTLTAAIFAATGTTLIEAPALLQLSNGAWRYYYDTIGQQRVWYMDSYDSWKTWKQPEPCRASPAIRHGSIQATAGTSLFPTTVLSQ